MLAGFNALGMGATPIAGQLLVSRGVSYQDVFAVAALLSLCAAALFVLLARVMPANAATARADGAARCRIGPARLVLASGVGPSLLMVALGACVFTTMTSYQATFAASRGLNPSVFYACYTAGVIVPRFTVTRLLAGASPATATTALLAGMCLSLAGFLLAGHDPVGYAASSALLGVTYGLAYPLIQAQAANSAPDSRGQLTAVRGSCYGAASWRGRGADDWRARRAVRPGQPRPGNPAPSRGYPQVTLYDANGRVLPLRYADGGGTYVTSAPAFGYAW